MKPNESMHIILYDDMCSLCNGSVQFVIKHDKKNRFMFASLQSDYAQKLLNITRSALSSDTVMLLTENSLLIKSDAALEIARNLSGGWSLMYVFKIVPRFIRDALYDKVAKYRYRFFGPSKSCLMPSPDVRSKFLT